MEFDNNTIAALLNLPDIMIDRVVFEQPRTIKVYLHSTVEGTNCHQCGRPIDHGYGVGQELQFRHLPMGNYNVIVVIRPKRYQCQHCDGFPTTTQTLSWYHPRTSVTKAFEQHMLLELINSTLEDVSRKHQVGVDALQGMLDRCLSPEVDWDTIKTLDILGIDEISLKKGHRDFVVVISTYINDQLCVIGLLAERTKAAVTKFFSHYSQAVTKNSCRCLF